jgi:hypothetical protein
MSLIQTTHVPQRTNSALRAACPTVLEPLHYLKTDVCSYTSDVKSYFFSIHTAFFKMNEDITLNNTE